MSTVVALALFGFFLNSATFITRPESILRLPLLSCGRHVPAIFKQDFMVFTDGIYRPLPYALIALVRTFVSADNKVFWHLGLLGFHVLNAVLVFGIARHFAGRIECALMALALFLLHPLASAFVNQVNLFPHLLGGTFFLGGLLCYLRYTRTRKAIVYLLGLALFLSGLLTSRTILVLPLLLFLYEALYERTGVLRSFTRVLPFVVCTLLVTPFFLKFHPNMQFFVYPPMPHANGVWYWFYSFAAGGVDRIVALLRGWSTPAAVTELAGAMRSTWKPLTIFSGLLLLFWLVVNLRRMPKKEWLAVGVFLLLLSPLPHFGSPRNLTDDYASWSYRYVPLVGFALLAGAWMDRALARKNHRRRRLVMVVAAALVVIYGGLQVRSNVHARTPESYWRFALKANPRSEIASVTLGKLLLAEGREEEACGRLFSPVVGSLYESCLAMTRYYTGKREMLAAAVHFHIATRQIIYGLQSQEEGLTQAAMFCEACAFDFAEHRIAQVLMANPYNTAGLKLLAQVLGAKGYLRAAIGCLEEVAKIDPGDKENAKQLAVLKRRLYMPETDDPPLKVMAPEPGWLRYASGQGNDARIRNAVIRLAGTYPHDPAILLSASIFLSQTKQHGPALGMANEAATTLASYSYASATQFWVAVNAGKPDLALQVLERVQNLKPQDAFIWHWLGTTLVRARRKEMAAPAYYMALRADPNLAQTHNNLGVLLASQGKFEQALPHFRKAVALGKDDLAAMHQGLGYTLIALGRLDEAVKHCRKSIAFDSKQPHAYHDMARAFEGQGMYAESVRILSEGLKEIPGDMLLSWHLAAALATAPDPGLRDGEHAIRLAEAACRASKSPSPQLLDTLGTAYAEAGQFEQAVSAARRAIQLAENKGDILFVRAIRKRLLLYQEGKPYHRQKTMSAAPPD